MLIIEEYHPDVAKYKSGIATSVLVGAVLGQLGFGIVADKVFLKFLYGIIYFNKLAISCLYCIILIYLN